MKKKIFAALAAAVTGLCCLAAPVSAESQYRMGDVNRDGQVELADAQWALKEYTAVRIGQYPLGTVLDDEQRSLAMVTDRSILKDNAEYAQDHVVISDVCTILAYYTDCVLTHRTEYKGMDIIEYGKKRNWQYPISVPLNYE